MRRKTVHIAADIHRILKGTAAHEELPLEEVLDRIVRYSLNMPARTNQGVQPELAATPEFVPEALKR